MSHEILATWRSLQQIDQTDIAEGAPSWEPGERVPGSCSVQLLGQLWTLEAELIKKGENNQDRCYREWLPIREQFSRDSVLLTKQTDILATGKLNLFCS